MVNPTIIEEKPITLVEVKKSIKKIEKRDPELNYLTGRTKDYVDYFAKLSQKEGKKLRLTKKTPIKKTITTTKK